MTSKSPSSIKDFYRAQVHNNNSNSAKSIYKRQLDSSDNVSPSFKIPRSIDHDVVTLEDSDDEDSLTNEFLPVRGNHSVVSEIRRKVRSMGGIFKPALYAKTTHIVASNWNSEKVKYFRKANKPVMRPEWVFKCWEKREEISDLHELDDLALPVFAGMNFCVSGFNQQDRTRIRKMVENNGGNWQTGLILDRYDFDTEDTQRTQIGPNNKTTHLVVARKAGEKYKAAMSDRDVKIVNIDWINVSQLHGIPQMEDDPKYCLRDENALKELKRLERESKRKQLQGCSQNSATSTQDNSVPILPPKNNVTAAIEKLALTNMISYTCVFDGLSFCFCGLATKYLPHVKKIISRLGGTVYNELVPSVTHVIIGSEITSRDAYNINRHEEKYRRISKVDLNWIEACANHRSLFPSQCDVKLENFIEKIKCTQDLLPSEAKEIAYERALKSADEFVKEIDFAEKLNRNINFNKAKDNNNNNNHTAAKNGSRMGAIPVSPKLEITKDLHSQRGSIMHSIPVEWGSQPTD
ncbi:DNA topoisomerase 2-binding protein 1-A isoform X2 [Tetranychus urticae]|uniref:DNA topoisomerase 2-binding protein 1-A isoform X2 n=1 Tax=Tetranychus urticae TaxID=32264 RepID=UPI00077BA8E4|nr:DNA topoisomerase 2-binding protein 1-A isoform X2 [Tetranychus urticae]